MCSSYFTLSSKHFAKHSATQNLLDAQPQQHTIRHLFRDFEAQNIFAD
jgi:hypothetical protein